MDNTLWNEWDLEIHNTHDQVKRRLNSEKIKSEAISLFPDVQSAIIIGSDPVPYLVTLSECTCFDFLNRGLPCKHMYRLAAELEILDSWPKTNRKGTKALLSAMDDEIQRWQSEYIAGNISAKKYVKIVDALLSK